MPARGSLRGVVRVDGKPLDELRRRHAGADSTARTPQRASRSIASSSSAIAQFAPHVMAVPVGSTVSFPNFDPVFHNVFSLSESKSFDLGLYKNGDAREVTFDKEGIMHARLQPALEHVGISRRRLRAPLRRHQRERRLLLPQPAARAISASRRGAIAAANPTLTTVNIKAGSTRATVELSGDAPMALNTDKFGEPRSQGASSPRLDPRQISTYRIFNLTEKYK